MEFDDPIVGTTSLIREAIQSPNYAAGVAGWIIRKDGTAEFLDILVRGDVVASELDINNTTFGGEDRGRLHAYFDDVNLNQRMDWRIGQQNIDDFITGGAPSGASQTSPAEIRHEVRGSEGPELTFESGRFNGQNEAVLSLFGEAWDGSAPSGISLSPGIGGAINLQTGVIASPLRPETASLASDSTRQIVSTVFTSAIDTDELSVTIPAAPSQTIIVEVWAQCDITAGNGFFAFEVRANNAAGAQLQGPADGTGIIIANLAGARIGHFFRTPVTDADFANTPLFVRAMVRTSSGGTFTIQRARLTAQVSP